MRALTILPLLVVAPLSVSHAQRIRVELESGSIATGAAGVVVVVVNDRDSTVAQGVSNASGSRTLQLGRPGSYRVVVRRIGFLPVRSEPITLAAGDSATVRLALPAQQVMLPAITVTRARKQCAAQPENALAASMVWEQIRTALLASEASRRDSLVTTRVRTFERELGPGNTVTAAHSQDLGQSGPRPFSTPDPAMLSQKGYVQVDKSYSGLYYGPDAHVLLSPEFERDHCFGLVAGTGVDSASLGLDFHPVQDRGVADIDGTLWLDRSSLALQRVVFHYADIEFPAPVSDVGGEIEFQRLASGAWFPSYWLLRMPRFRAQSGFEYGRRWTLDGYVETGATATESHQVDMRAFLAGLGSARTTASRADTSPTPRVFVSGRAVDSLNGTPVPSVTVEIAARDLRTVSDSSGRYSLGPIEPGKYVLRARRIGYFEAVDTVALSPSGSFEHTFVLHRAPARLAEIEVNGQTFKYPAFFDPAYKRMARGVGHFFTHEDIDRAVDLRLLFNTIPGVWVNDRGLNFQRCEAGLPPDPFNVSPSESTTPKAKVQIWIDGVRVEGQRETNKSKNSLEAMLGVPPQDIQIMEVYTDISTIPAEFFADACAVIVIWTKRS